MTDPASIRLLVLDVDGVLTDGRIEIHDLGHESKSFHVRDGFAITQWIKSGYQVAIITGRSSRVVTLRAAELGIQHVFQGSRDKRADLEKVLKQAGCPPENAAAMGDDLPDLPLLGGIGYAVAVADAAPELKAVADYVTKTPGGCGAVREVIEHLLKARDGWDEVVERFR